MARRDRTTAIPRRHEKAAAAKQSRFDLDSNSSRLAVLGFAVVLLLAVVGLFAYRVYESRVGTPNKVVLRVGDERYNLRYYSDRLGPYVSQNQNSGSSLTVLEDDLLNKLETEGLTVSLARKQGIDLSDTAVREYIAEQLGVSVGGSGSSFDSLYRAQLRTLHLADGTYRRLKTAELADAKLKDLVEAELGTKAEQYTLRVIISSDEAGASTLVTRIRNGEDMGALAQVESLDLESRQQDGILQPEPLELFPENVKAALNGAAKGTLLGPVKVQDNWWVFRVEEIATRDYSTAQLQQIAQARFDAQLQALRAELRAEGKLKRDLTSSDLKWAVDNTDVPDQAAQ